MSNSESKHDGKKNQMNDKKEETRKIIKYKVDTSGKLFSFISSPKIPCVYRFWATLKDSVNVIDLQKAVDNIMKRFPYYHVTLKKGFSWFYWQRTTKKVQVSMEREYPCQYIPIREPNTIPFRVIAKNNQIIIEFNHSLTDGSGALIFLKSLIAEYYHIRGLLLTEWEGIFRVDQQPKEEETEYSIRKHFRLGIPKVGKSFRAFHLPFHRINHGIFIVTNGKMNVKDVLKVSKKFGVTLTEFIVAIYIDVLQDILLSLPPKQQKRLKRPIRIMVPINIRNHLPSKTMWNFTAFVVPGIDPRLGDFTFQEIIDQVHHYKNLQVNKKFIVQQISSYMAIEGNMGLISPRFIKKWFIRPIYRNIGENIFSAFMTNLGVTSLPSPLSNEVKDIQLLPMNHPYVKSSCSLLTYNNELNINFGRCIEESIVEDKFFAKLQEFGIKVKITKMNEEN